MLLAGIRFVTPLAGLIAIALVLPLAAYRISSARIARGRKVLRLPEPKLRHNLELVALVSVPLLLGVAAAGPTINTHVGRRIRTDAQALFIFDTSRSMAAAASFTAPTRLQHAQTDAIELRNAIPGVRSGVASLTTELLPHLFPTLDEDAFDSTVRDAVGVEKPPPPFLQYGIRGTSFGPLAELRAQGFFTPTTTHRLAILLTDGESGAIDAESVGKALTLATGYPPPPLYQSRNAATAKPQPTVSLFIIRVGNGADRIFTRNGGIEAAYRPDPTAVETLQSLEQSAHARVFSGDKLRAAAAALRSVLGSGHVSSQGVTTKTIQLAPYLVLLGLVPLGFLVWRRNLAATTFRWRRTTY